jgi:prepilin-type N-terminal cleavage/methylation domain-containing protein
MRQTRRGLTLIEIVITIAIIAVLTGVYFLIANPANQLAGARNTRRGTDLQVLMSAVKENIADQGNNQFGCASAGPLPTSTIKMGSASGSYNIAPCLIPADGIYVMPFDPNASSAYYASVSNYNTGYSIMMNASGSVTLSAPYAELGKTVSLTQ